MTRRGNQHVGSIKKILQLLGVKLKEKTMNKQSLISNLQSHAHTLIPRHHSTALLYRASGCSILGKIRVPCAESLLGLSTNGKSQ